MDVKIGETVDTVQIGRGNCGRGWDVVGVSEVIQAYTRTETKAR